MKIFDDEIIACVIDLEDAEVASRICGVGKETAEEILENYAEPYGWPDDLIEEYDEE